MIERIRLAWEFWTDDVAITATSYVGNMSPNNLKTPRPSIVWRSSSTEDQAIVSDLGRTRLLSFLLFYNHNFSPSSTLRVEISKVPSFNPTVMDQTFRATRATYGFGRGPFGQVGFGGYSKEGLRLPYTVCWFNSVIGRYVRTTIHDPNNPDGFVQSGRYVVGNYWTPEFANAEWAPALQPIQMSTQTLLKNGGTIADSMPAPREFSFQINRLTKNDEIKIQECIQFVGLNRNVFVSLYPESNNITERLYTLLGFLKQGSVGGTSRTNLLHHSFSTTVREAL